MLVALLAPAPTHAAPEGTAAPQTVAERAIARINHYRVRFGLTPLRGEPRLDLAAQRHARDMAENGFFAHAGSDGSGVEARANRAGYDWRRIAENIAAGTVSPEAVVDGWMASPGHRRNLLDPAFRHAGVGHAVVDPDRDRRGYRHYWCLVLGAPARH